jgi:3-phosphoshikimate 1-carboxyvinyltransferase
LHIEGLFENSLQGDSVLTELYRLLGVRSTWNNGVLVLERQGEAVSFFEYDFSDCPDLAQTVVVTCAALGIPGRFSGLESLRIKETDRTAALSEELRKFGVQFVEEGDAWLLSGTCQSDAMQEIETYEDHRMAMCFAPLALHFPIKIKESEVVKKSYPSFWDDLERLGFTVSLL